MVDGGMAGLQGFFDLQSVSDADNQNQRSEGEVLRSKRGTSQRECAYGQSRMPSALELTHDM
jgi:hypothetical protein